MRSCSPPRRPGLELADLAGLAAEMYEKSRQDKPGTGDDDGTRARRSMTGP